MLNRWLIVIPLSLSLLIMVQKKAPEWLTQPTVKQVVQQLSPPPSAPSPSPSMPSPCDVLSSDEVATTTNQSYLPPRLSVNQRRNGLLLQKCLWLPTDEKLTPTITTTLLSSEGTDSASLTTYWQEYIDQNVHNTRFTSLVATPGATTKFADSWGTHQLQGKYVLIIQASMPSPATNQSTEEKLLQLSLPRLSESD